MNKTDFMVAFKINRKDLTEKFDSYFRLKAVNTTYDYYNNKEDPGTPLLFENCSPEHFGLDDDSTEFTAYGLKDAKCL